MIDDASSDVLIQLALTLGEDPSAEVFPLMERLYARRSVEPGSCRHWSPAWVGGNLPLLTKWKRPAAKPGRFLTPLASSVVHRAEPKEIARLVALIANAGSDGRPLAAADRRARCWPASPMVFPGPLSGARCARAPCWFPPNSRRSRKCRRLRRRLQAAAAQIVGRLGQLEEAARGNWPPRPRPLTGAEERLYEAGGEPPFKSARPVIRPTEEGAAQRRALSSSKLPLDFRHTIRNCWLASF